MYPLFPFEPEEAVIEPRQIVRPAENFPKCCLAVFSAPIFEKIRTRPEAEEIASVGNANGEVPVYHADWRARLRRYDGGGYGAWRRPGRAVRLLRRA